MKIMAAAGMAGILLSLLRTTTSLCRTGPPGLVGPRGIRRMSLLLPGMHRVESRCGVSGRVLCGCGSPSSSGRGVGHSRGALAGSMKMHINRISFSQFATTTTSDAPSPSAPTGSMSRTEYVPSNEFGDIELPPNTISWYPGHIAKAERELVEYLKKVDVVIEVRDARIPLATSHPLVPKWVGKSKPLIVVVNRIDQISPSALREWKTYYSHYPPYFDHSKESADNELHQESKVFFVDGKTGQGILSLRRQVLKAGVVLNQRRKKRGMLPRAVRAMVIGYPNVGKSALINRLLHRKLARSYNKPGVTRLMQWIRIGKDGEEAKSAEESIELLDSPGIIPAKQVDQLDAVKLAICNDIGEASYDRVTVTIAMFELLRRLQKQKPGYVNAAKIQQRFKVDMTQITGDEVINDVAYKLYKDNLISAADRLLSEFRKGMIGKNSLESPPVDVRTLKPKQPSTTSTKKNNKAAANMHDSIQVDDLEDEEDEEEDYYEEEEEGELFMDGDHDGEDIGDADDDEASDLGDLNVGDQPSTTTKSKKKDKNVLFNIDIEAGRGKYDGW
jgi:ribosome biogenesis GTPase A